MRFDIFLDRAYSDRTEIAAAAQAFIHRGKCASLLPLANSGKALESGRTKEKAPRVRRFFQTILCFNYDALARIAELQRTAKRNSTG